MEGASMRGAKDLEEPSIIRSRGGPFAVSIVIGPAVSAEARRLSTGNTIPDLEEGSYSSMWNESTFTVRLVSGLSIGRPAKASVDDGAPWLVR